MLKGRLGLRAEVEGLRDILRVAQMVVSSLDLDTTLDRILRSAMEVMALPAGSIALFDERSKTLQLHAHAGFSADFVAMDRWQVAVGGLTDKIMNRAEPMIVGDLAKFLGRVPGPIAREGIRSMIAIPLKSHLKIVGILYLNDFTPRRFSPRRLRLLTILASFAAMSIDNARLHQQMRKLATTDGLTGLLNHRRFKQQLQEETVRALRYNKNLSIVMLDIDNFKVFNDTYGHPKGDEALLVVTDLLRQVVRESDLIFRYGGEEFIIILPETGNEEALKAAERLRSLIETESQRRLGMIGTAGITASVGVASFPRDGSTAESLLLAVDQLLYRAKSAGKNQVVHRPQNPAAVTSEQGPPSGDWGCQSP